MKSKSTHILVPMVIITMAILFSSCGKSNKASDKIVVNDNIIQTKEFSVNSDSTDLNTSANGTVFIKGSEGIPEGIQIVAHIEVDPDDWGGVVFYIPKKWNIESINSSYPENQDTAKPADYIATFSTGDTERYEWDKFVEVGRDRSHIPTGGGTGTVVIDLIADKDVIQQSEKFNITVAVGSDEKDGTKIMETDSTTIEIP
ncbi:hypothetical protein [Vallitalea maricola]|uniref:Uncharacterized protein n=1 Tax=Vallitalea maricola TaxID=3074433 RepID=A0ACB5UGR3_9FIRM|nr:hypothetical protein AN2V17_10040 [Vallitalea sp. AN17-2]